MYKKGRKIILTESELVDIKAKRRDGFVWKEIAKDFDCSINTVRMRYIEWKNRKFERNLWQKLKYFFRKLFQ